MNKEETKKYINKIIDKTAEMCFCKRHICKRCEYGEVLNLRCSNENLRNEVLKKLNEFVKKLDQPKLEGGEKCEHNITPIKGWLHECTNCDYTEFEPSEISTS